MSKAVSSWRWWISHASFPLDIQWENLHIPSIVWWSRWIFINFVLCLFLFFFTTAPVLVASVTQIRVALNHVLNKSTNPEDLEKELNSVSPFINIYISNLLMLAIATLLVFCVSRSYLLECHWTQSRREQAVMRKTFIFLILMLIILPSIGLTSVNALAQNVIEHQSDLREKLNCIFLPGSGAFFVVYVLTAGLIGTAVELLKVPELFHYLYFRLNAKTRWQKEQALKKAGDWDFLYGVQYAWHLVIFTMVITYSLITPIITPFGVLYFILRYFTDKYNIYYVYKPAPFNGRQFLHRSAINFVIVGAVHLQISTLFFSVVRLGKLDGRSILMIAVLCVTVTTCIVFMLFGWFSHMLPSLRDKMGQQYRMFSLTRQGGAGLNDTQEKVKKGAYIPPVLKVFTSESGVPDEEDSINGYQSFGSTDKLGRRSPVHSASNSPRSTKSPETTTSASSPERKPTNLSPRQTPPENEAMDYNRYTSRQSQRKVPTQARVSSTSPVASRVVGPGKYSSINYTSDSDEERDNK